MRACKSTKTNSDFDCSHRGMDAKEIKASPAYRSLTASPKASPWEEWD